MKKYLLSAVIILSFIFYSYTNRKNQTLSVLDAMPVSPNPISGTTNPQTNTSAGTNPPNVANSATTAGSYKDGTFTGDVTDAFYGNIQVAAVIQSGKLTDVTILQYPNDRSRSIAINSQALPILQSEAVQAQTASVDIVSGATDTSQAFMQSLDSALSKAR